METNILRVRVFSVGLWVVLAGSACGGGGGGQADAGLDARDGGRDAAGGATGSGGGAGQGGTLGAGGAGTGGTAAGGTAGTMAGATGGAGAGGVGGATPGTGGATGGVGVAGAPGTGGGGDSGGAGGTPSNGGNGGGAGMTGSGGASTGGAGGVVGTGGAGTGGMPGTGGAGTGGAGTGGAGTGGTGTGGAGTGGAGTGGAGTGGTGTGGAANSGMASLYVVSHPDDELLFANPDLQADIVAGKRVRTVYVTSGDGEQPFNDFARQREIDVLKAHAEMAGLSPNTTAWTCAPAAYGGRMPVRCTLPGRPMVSAVFIRLPDGRVREVWDGIAHSAIDGSGNMYTRAQLLATLRAIHDETQPQKVGTLDGTLAHGYDHTDHVATGWFTFDVARGDGMNRQLVMYRGYSMYPPSFVDPPVPLAEAANLSTALYTEKRRIMQVYSAVNNGDDFDEWCMRFYPIPSVTLASGLLRADGGSMCLAAASSADGAAVGLAACAAGDLQNWTVQASGRVTGSLGKCLTVASGGTSVVLTGCSGGTNQMWTLLEDKQLRGSGNVCLTAGTSSVTAAPCTAQEAVMKYQPSPSQRWSR